MLQLLAEFSIQQILIYTVILGLAIKGLIDFSSWGYKQYQKRFHRDYEALNTQEKLEKHYMSCKEQHTETLNLYKGLETKIDNLTENINTRIDVMEDQLIQLTESDMHDIKGWIVEKHHQYIKKGWIDDFTMDILEKRFADYKKEGGNSYVGGLMEELRALPHTIPEGEE